MRAGLVETVALIIAGSALVGGCSASLSGGPQRIFSAQESRASARDTLVRLEQAYLSTPDSDSIRRQRIRNDYIGESMQAIDAQYTAYEQGLTRDRQSIGFGASATALSLNTAGTLASGGTSRILGGLAGLATGVEGKYESEIILAKTIDIIEGQMRASRDTIAASILSKMSRSDDAYPLSVAKSDLEDYFRAGTLNTGLQQAATSSGQNAQAAQADKARTIDITYGPDDSTQTLLNYLYASGADTLARAKELDAILATIAPDRRVRDLLYDANGAELRAQLIDAARKSGIKL